MDEDRPIYNVEDAMEEGRKETKTGGRLGGPNEVNSSLGREGSGWT